MGKRRLSLGGRAHVDVHLLSVDHVLVAYRSLEMALRELLRRKLGRELLLMLGLLLNRVDSTFGQTC